MYFSGRGTHFAAVELRLACFYIILNYVPRVTVISHQSIANVLFRQVLRQTVPRTHNRFGDRSFAVAGPGLWNSLPISLRQISHYGQFRRYLKNHLFGIWEITAQCDAWFSALYKYSYLLTYLLNWYNTFVRAITTTTSQLTCIGCWFNTGICCGRYVCLHAAGGDVGGAITGDGGCAYMLTGPW